MRIAFYSRGKGVPWAETYRERSLLRTQNQTSALTEVLYEDFSITSIYE